MGTAPIYNLRQRMLDRLRRERRQLRRAGSVRVWLLYLPGPGPLLMSWLRKRWVLLRNPHARIEFHGPVYLGPGFSLDMPRGGTLIVGQAVEFRRGFRAEFANPESTIIVGDATIFTYDVLVQCSTAIEIGQRCQFGQTTILLDAQHRFRDLTRPMLEQGYDFHPLRIEDDATVTSKCTIMSDLGRRAFIGAGSVVTRPVPAYTVAVGAPARAIEYFGPPGEEPAELRATVT